MPSCRRTFFFANSFLSMAVMGTTRKCGCFFPKHFLTSRPPGVIVVVWASVWSWEQTWWRWGRRSDRWEILGREPVGYLWGYFKYTSEIWGIDTKEIATSGCGDNHYSKNTFNIFFWGIYSDQICWGVDGHLRYMSNEKRAPFGCLGYIVFFFLPSLAVGIIRSHCKDPVIEPPGFNGKDSSDHRPHRLQHRLRPKPLEINFWMKLPVIPSWMPQNEAMTFSRLKTGEREHHNEWTCTFPEN